MEESVVTVTQWEQIKKGLKRHPQVDVDCHEHVVNGYYYAPDGVIRFTGSPVLPTSPLGSTATEVAVLWRFHRLSGSVLSWRSFRDGLLRSSTEEEKENKHDTLLLDEMKSREDSNDDSRKASKANGKENSKAKEQVDELTQLLSRITLDQPTLDNLWAMATLDDPHLSLEAWIHLASVSLHSVNVARLRARVASEAGVEAVRKVLRLPSWQWERRLWCLICLTRIQCPEITQLFLADLLSVHRRLLPTRLRDRRSYRLALELLGTVPHSCSSSVCAFSPVKRSPCVSPLQ